MKRTLCMLLAITLLMTLCSCTAPEQLPTNGENANLSETEQWELLSEAYRYTFPLMIMNQTMKTATNVETPDLSGHAPVNQLIHAQKLADADAKMVVTPNVDTIYTQAWLDLTEEPMVFVMPKTDRYFQTQVLDAWTNTPAVLESGNYLIAREGYEGEVPENLTLVEVPTDMVWMISRILVNGAEDMSNLKEIQNDMKLMPLSIYQSNEEYTPEKGEHKEEYDGVPVNLVLSMTPQDYFSKANELMLKNPPSEQDAAILEKIAVLNIGPGKQFDASVLQGDVQENWKAMLSSLKEMVYQEGIKYQKTIGDWSYFGEPIGNFGNAYDYRAMIALSGLGANPMEVAVYFKTGTDSEGNALNGQNDYILHFDSLPPVSDGGFWSVTAYGSDDFLIANELDKYCINDRTDLSPNEDGTLDIILSSEAPENTANWLPVGADNFHLVMRSYLPNMDALNNGWNSPTITKTANREP